MKRIFALLILLATFASAQTDSTDILITIREDGDTTQVGKWRAGMPVLIRNSWDGWGEREKQGNKFVIIRVGIAKARIDSFLVAHSDSTSGLRRKYQLSRAAIRFVKNNRDANNVVRVTPAQLRNAFKRANRLRRFGEPQRMSIIPDRLYIRWRNMLIGATPTTATVNTDGGGDYTSLAAAESGEQKDLVAANEQLTISCRGTTADVAVITFAGWTTDATRYPSIVGNNTSGKWDATKYRIISTATLTGVIYVAQNGMVIEMHHLQIHTNHSSNYLHGFWVQFANKVVINDCLFKGSAAGNTHNDGVFQNAASNVYISNSVFVGFKNGTIESNAIRNNNHGGTILSYNNTIYDCKIGHRIMLGTITSRNCIYQSNSIAAADGYQSGVTGDNNLSDIASDAPGVNSITATVNFADAANSDFRLLPESPGINQGVDLSTDLSYPFNTAIDGTLRPQGAAWDIGAFEYVQPATNNDKKSRYKGFGTGFKGGWKK